VKPAIPLWACMQRFVGTSDIEDFKSPALTDNSTGRASVSRLFASSPRYLVLHMCRYYVDDKWQPQKLEVEVMKNSLLSFRIFPITFSSYILYMYIIYTFSCYIFFS
jgi:hypothetical protein